ncbi:LOW QUALITY PROTEIN: hypothetical protein BRARA_G00829 [Brassica rapa]|uniref:thioglucosidase n=1 Tax=Brassica campestris TaxID=3711 RepID=A0A397YJE6_BRACM|nr:LOW QUALITY PROTEIN: hypothetical protein BRARA_G00829 [Brassica rapa]
MELFLFLVTICLSLAFSGKCSDDYSRNDFPEGFVFGSARIFGFSGNGSNGDIACDGYHKYKEDVRLMYDMGLDALRLSISWSRLIPSGRGPVNSKGLRFYKNLIHELKTHGIEPHVTLHHNDLPQALEDEYGGWIDRKIIGDFTAFADVCFKEFGNAVKFWSTINEPNIVAWVGYDLGSGPPSHCSPPCGMHKQNGFVGITCFAFWMVPFTSSEEDEMATQRAKDFLLGWVLHPLMFGDYPNVMRRITAKISEEESYLVKDSSDFLGLIHYTTTYTADLSSPRQGDYASDMHASIIRMFFLHGIFWVDLLPWGLEGLLEYIKQNYGNPPIYILENEFFLISTQSGRPTNHQSSLNDAGRIEYLHSYIAAVLNSVRNGSETRGYFQFHGFVRAHGAQLYIWIILCKFQRSVTSPKTSALWYSCFLNGTTNCSEELSASSSPGLFSGKVPI